MHQSRPCWVWTGSEATMSVKAVSVATSTVPNATKGSSSSTKLSRVHSTTASAVASPEATPW